MQFVVKYNDNDNIALLKEKIKKEKPNTCKNVPTNFLLVWQCKEPKLLLTTDRMGIDEFLRSISFHKKRGAVKLSSERKLKDLGLGDEEVLLTQLPGKY